MRDGARDKKGFGHGKGYLYPHAYHNHWVPQQYLPDSLEGKIFYKPSDSGYEKNIKNVVLMRREANLEASASPFPEVLSTVPRDHKRDIWITRLISGYSTMLSQIRDTVFEKALLSPHHRVLVINPGNGLLLWEACRRITSGLIHAVPGDKLLTATELDTLMTYASRLPELEQPVIKNVELTKFTPPEGITYERIVGMNVLTRIKNKTAFLQKLKKLLSEEGIIVLSEVIPSASTRLTELLSKDKFEDSQWSALLKAEEGIYISGKNPITGWTEKDIEKSFEEAGFSIVEMEKKEYTQTRHITEEDITKWFSPSASGYGYGDYLREGLSPKNFANTREKIIQSLAGKEVPWKQRVCPLVARV